MTFNKGCENHSKLYLWIYSDILNRIIAFSSKYLLSSSIGFVGHFCELVRIGFKGLLPLEISSKVTKTRFHLRPFRVRYLIDLSCGWSVKRKRVEIYFIVLKKSVYDTVFHLLWNMGLNTTRDLFPIVSQLKY